MALGVQFVTYIDMNPIAVPFVSVMTICGLMKLFDYDPIPNVYTWHLIHAYDDDDHVQIREFVYMNERTRPRNAPGGSDVD
jgi:hypothetical protein